MSETKKKRKFLQNATDVIYHPYVRKVSKFAKIVLEAMSWTDFSSKASMAVSAVSLFDSAIEAFELPTPTKIEQWTKKQNLIESFGYLAMIVVSTGIVSKAECKIVCTDEGSALREIKFDFGSLFYVEGQDPGVYYENELDRIHGYFYTTTNFSYEKLFDKMWEKFDQGIYLSITVSSDEDMFTSRSLRLNKLSKSHLFYMGQRPKLEEFVKELEDYRNSNISRSYILAGLPGLGKTSFAVCAASHTGGRIVKVDPSVAKQMGSAELEFVVKNLAPNIILFDDFDKAVEDSDQLFFTIENIKQQFPKIAIFATVNQYGDMDPAYRRPGRFDETIWFVLPDDKEREAVIKYYFEKYNVNCNKKKLNELVAITENLTQAYIMELCTRISRKGFGCVEKTMQEFSKNLSYDLDVMQEGMA